MPGGGCAAGGSGYGGGMDSVAIIGTGIAGMGCAWRLHRHVRLTLFEAEAEPGGHTHTVDVVEDGNRFPVDTGFMVYNEVTYPLLTRLFAELGVQTTATDMSFGVQYRPHDLEYCGSGLNRFFAQRRNLLRPRFWRMTADILRFNRLAVGALSQVGALDLTLAEFAERHRFSAAFLQYYLVPMTSAIWSTPPDEMLRFPAHTLLRFMHNHGLLGLRTHHQWRTVTGGSRQYRDKLLAPFRDRVRCGCPVVAVRRTGRGVAVRDATGAEHAFDKVVLATHADTSLRLLEAPTPDERRLLARFPYARNTITLHTDAAVMPRARRAWASWNYRVDALPDGRHHASTHYWMNSLQKLPGRQPYFVSVNGAGLVDRGRVLREFVFDHPMFDKAAVEAQFELPRLNGNGRVYFCGSYFRYGFHEDGLMAGYAAADRLLQQVSAHAELPV